MTDYGRMPEYSMDRSPVYTVKLSPDDKTTTQLYISQVTFDQMKRSIPIQLLVFCFSAEALDDYRPMFNSWEREVLKNLLSSSNEIRIVQRTVTDENIRNQVMTINEKLKKYSDHKVTIRSKNRQYMLQIENR